MTDWTRSTVLAGVLVALALSSLGGCGGAPKPAPVDNPPVSASSSPTGAPTLPAEATGTTPEAAEAVVKFFVDALDYGGRSGDTTPMRSVMSPNCECIGIAEFIDKTYRNKGHIRGDGWTLISSTFRSKSAGRVVVEAMVKVAPQEVVRSPGAATKHYPGTDKARKLFTMTADSGGWQIVEIGQPDG